MTLKKIIFPYFYVFFPITPNIRATNKNELQIWIPHRKIHQLKEKKKFYMTLNDNNTCGSANRAARSADCA